MIQVRRFGGMNLLVHPASEPPEGAMSRIVNADSFVAGALYPRRGLARMTTFNGLLQTGTNTLAAVQAGTFGTPIYTACAADGRCFDLPALEHAD